MLQPQFNPGIRVGAHKIAKCGERRMVKGGRTMHCDVATVASQTHIANTFLLTAGPISLWGAPPGL